VSCPDALDKYDFDPGSRKTKYLRRRRHYTILTFVTAIALLTWGAFVTSINAGLAVPDWPTSFNSYDPLNPLPGWWKITPILAEHGHRLLGALIGFFTLVLAVWTWFADHRKWMRWLGVGALVLVIVQGVLGGLRVIWVSIDLAIVHALVAQLFFALLASMALFLTQTWRDAKHEPVDSASLADLKSILWIAPIVLFIQIFLGALLRHPGTGIDPFFAGLHLGWACGTGIAVAVFWIRVRSGLPESTLVIRLAGAMLSILIFQVILGLVAYFVLLDESGALRASNFQVIANTTHMVTGALLFACTVSTSVLCARIRSAHSPN